MDYNRLKIWIEDLLRIIFPDVCEVCGHSLVRGEEVLCLNCTLKLPRTKIHRENFNLLHQRLAGSTPICRAGGYFYYYRESDYAELIHRAKYKDRPIIATRLAQHYAKEIKPDSFFDGIDLILPVPLHLTKKIKRGYNQSEAIAKGISKETGIPIAHNLIAKRSHSTQTRKNSYSRWINAQGIYDVIDAQNLTGKHILIVDDVITTGATMLACCNTIHKASPTTAISVLSLGVTHLH